MQMIEAGRLNVKKIAARQKRNVEEAAARRLRFDRVFR